MSESSFEMLSRVPGNMTSMPGVSINKGMDLITVVTADI
jgi:hypothetical protein